MDPNKSSVDRLNETLNSRTEYTPPGDKRSPVRSSPVPEAPVKWNSPELDTLIRDHKEQGGSPLVKKVFFFSVAVFIIALGAAGYIYYGGSNFISTKNVDIQITGPAAIEAGQPLALTVSVENKNNAEIDAVKLSVQYPDGTRQADDETQTLARDNVTIPSISSGGVSTQTFRSALFGEKGVTETLKFSLEYKIPGSTATFYKDKTFDITIGDTPLVLSVEKPSTVSSGDTFEVRISVASNSTDILNNVIVHAEYSYGFGVQSTDPAATQDSNTWNLGDLAPGSKKVIVVRGSIVGVDAEERTFRFYAGLADPTNMNNLSQPLISTTETVTIARPEVSLSIDMNGDTSGDYIAPSGSPIRAVLKYENNSTDKLTRPHIVVHLSGAALDKSSVSPEDQGVYNASADQISWQLGDGTDAGGLAPGESGNVAVTFASEQNLPLGQNPQVVLDASISGETSAGTVLTKDTRTVKISSTVNLTSKALYSRGPFANTGPLPPKANATTTYTIVWDLGNTQNEVNNAVVTGRLGANVRFLSGGTGDDAVTYDEGTQTVTWNAGTLVSGAGYSKPLREAVFQVAIVPSIGQIGTVPTLVSGISFSGTDSFTHMPVTAALPAITTRLSSDSKFTQGDETVVK